MTKSEDCGHGPTAPCRTNGDSTTKYFPKSASERRTFVNVKTGRPLTSFQYAVYDLCAQIPEGRFSTYQDLAKALQGNGARAVGNALRINPFAPLPVPCHRVVQSSFYMGGYNGVMQRPEQAFCGKSDILVHEGVRINNLGYIDESLRTSLRFTDFKPVVVGGDGLIDDVVKKEEDTKTTPPAPSSSPTRVNRFTKFEHSEPKRLQSRAR